MINAPFSFLISVKFGIVLSKIYVSIKFGTVPIKFEEDMQKIFYRFVVTFTGKTVGIIILKAFI